MPYISLTIFVKLFQKPNSLAKLLSLLSVFFLFFFVTHGQEASTPYFHNAENEISLLAGQMSDVKFNDSLLFQRNDSLQQLVFNTLKAENSFSYLFDSLKHIGCIKSEDGLLRIFTWNLVKADGTHHHYGFMQYYLKAQKEVLLIPLTDKSDSISDFFQAEDGIRDWSGTGVQTCALPIRSEEHTSELQSLTNLVFRLIRSEAHTSELQSLTNLVCRLLLEKKKTNKVNVMIAIMSQSHQQSRNSELA